MTRVQCADIIWASFLPGHAFNQRGSALIHGPRVSYVKLCSVQFCPHSYKTSCHVGHLSIHGTKCCNCRGKIVAWRVIFNSDNWSLTLNMLNCFNDYKRCIHILYHILEFIQQKETKFTIEQHNMSPILYCQYHVCWCLGDLRSQCISSHGIDSPSWNIPSLASDELIHGSCWLNLIKAGPGGHFKNTYELLNLRALKFSPVNKIHIFQCMGMIFCVEFQRYPLKFHTKYLIHTLKDMTFIQHWNFKLICIFEMPPLPWLQGDRMWSFAVGLYLVYFDGGVLLLAAVYGVIMCLCILLLGGIIGRWVDNNPRLRGTLLSHSIHSTCRGCGFSSTMRWHPYNLLWLLTHRPWEIGD